MGSSNRIVTLFGGSGFIGRYVVHRLGKLENTTLRIPCRHPHRLAHLKTAGGIGQIVPMAVDIRNEAQVGMAVAGADVVINLLGILNETRKGSFQAIHADAAGRIARLAAAADVGRMVHVSALGANEASESRYARSKALGEREVLAAFPKATILRPSLVFGAEDNFFNMFAAMACWSPVLPLIGGGHTRFQPIYVGDVADAIMVAAWTPVAQGCIYELGGSHVYSFRQLMELILRQIRRSCWLLPIPWPIATLQAALLEWLPSPPMTRDQLTLLKTDNVVGLQALKLNDLGLVPTALEMMLPSILSRFRRL